MRCYSFTGLFIRSWLVCRTRWWMILEIIGSIVELDQKVNLERTTDGMLAAHSPDLHMNADEYITVSASYESVTSHAQNTIKARRTLRPLWI